MNSDFRLSRIQAEGWNAARGLAASRLAEMDEEAIAKTNPYTSDPERSRWQAGFRSARENL